MKQRLPTVLELLGKATSFFQEAGIQTARLDAQVLLADILGMDRLHLYVNYDRPLEQHEVNAYRQAVVRRAKRVPVAYITGKKEFMSLEFKVTPAVLVPRPETELLVETASELLKRRDDQGEGAVVADVGTGSGVIAVCLAKLPEVKMVWAIDVSPDALAVARYNGKEHGVNSKVQWVQGDLLQPLLKAGVKVDMVVTNPPYIPTEAIGSDCTEVRWEPKTALDGGKDGLKYYRLLAAQVPRVLREGGWLCMEIGFDQGPSVSQLLEATGRFGQVRVVTDLAGHDRIVVAAAQ